MGRRVKVSLSFRVFVDEGLGDVIGPAFEKRQSCHFLNGTACDSVMNL